MPEPDPVRIVEDCFRAFERSDRDLIERRLAPGLVFSAPPDVGIDRTAFFERCWPGAGHLLAFDLVRQVALPEGEVLTTYEATREDGTRFRNTEVHHVVGEQVDRIEVYFGWDLDAS